MKHIVLIFSILVLSIVLGHYWQEDPGYMLLVIHGWQIQSSAVFFLILLAMIVTLLGLGFKLFSTFIQMPGAVLHLFQKWRANRASQNIHQAIEAFYQGQTDQALKKLGRHAADVPWLVDLIAATAAQAENKLEERDKFIHLASLNRPEALSSILLFQVGLQLEKQQIQAAQTMLNQVPNKSPKYYALQLEIYQKQHLYAPGLALLEQHKYLLELNADFLNFYRCFFKQQFLAYLEKNQIDAAYTLYQNRPKCLKNDKHLIGYVCPSLMQDKRFFKPLSKSLKHIFLLHPEDPELLSLFPKLAEANQWQMLLEQQPSQSAAYFLALGQLKAKQKLWGAAIQDLEKSIQIKTSRQAWSCLSKIYLDLQQTANALAAMQHALNIEERICLT